MLWNVVNVKMKVVVKGCCAFPSQRRATKGVHVCFSSLMMDSRPKIENLPRYSRGFCLPDSLIEHQQLEEVSGICMSIQEISCGAILRQQLRAGLVHGPQVRIGEWDNQSLNTTTALLFQLVAWWRRCFALWPS